VCPKGTVGSNPTLSARAVQKAKGLRFQTANPLPFLDDEKALKLKTGSLRLTSFEDLAV